ncbi:hypothetical protein [Sulfuricurvum sp.]|uniref:hypothetical protein n=1 Tax=Sulfuricurvum sp. TaxID=2025608 RepID=UPI00262BABA3|nr:hypothetical protein [Sulfuricurvum sp.]MDD4884182.1 hypothetical protein [Sulfuricurvum sp.]
MKKIVGMSLLAAVLLGSNASAIDNVKVNGDAKLYYHTDNQDSGDLFNQSSSAADTALRLGISGDLLKNVAFGITGYAISTLGLENSMVASAWSSAHTVSNPGGSADVSDEAWLGELWIATTFGKTTFKAGRMLLDSPLSFSETWSIAPNSYEAFVLLNQDIPDTTVVLVYAGHSNGVNSVGYTNPIVANNTSGNGLDGVLADGAKFGTHGAQGADVAGIINNSYKPLTAQAWYWNAEKAADAYWLQGDLACEWVKGLKMGAQYAYISPKGVFEGVHDSEGLALMLGYNGIENLKVSAAYSDIDKNSVFKIANLATNNTVSAQSKLYTEAFWNRGYVGSADAQSWKMSAEYDAGIAELGASYTNVNNAIFDTLATPRIGVDMQEIALTVKKSFGSLDTTLVYISTDADDQNNGSQSNALQVYLTLNF